MTLLEANKLSFRKGLMNNTTALPHDHIMNNFIFEQCFMNPSTQILIRSE